MGGTSPRNLPPGSTVPFQAPKTEPQWEQSICAQTEGSEWANPLWSTILRRQIVLCLDFQAFPAAYSSSGESLHCAGGCPQGPRGSPPAAQAPDS
eukprot:5343459-Pyramimonas_sp.AAC.2